MIDNFALLVSHGLMMLVAVLLMRHPDLDRESSPPPPPAGERPRA